MDTVKTSILYLLLSGAITMILAPIMINVLYTFRQTADHQKSKLGGGMKGTNALYLKVMKATGKNGTPNMGGVLIWLIVPAIALIFLPKNEIFNLFNIGFLVLGFWGLVDVVISNKMKYDEHFRTMQESFPWRLGKLLIMVLINMLIMYLMYRWQIVREISLTHLLTLSFTPILIPVFGIVSQFAVYSSEITDGLDGLVVGIFIIIFAAFAILLYLQGEYEFIPLIGIILGVLITDLYFNIPPARFFNGGPGAMPIGFAAFFIGLATDNVIPYFIITSLTWVIMLSSMIQILSMRFFKRRVFIIAPLHHHFQAKGWLEHTVTMRFWLFTLVLSIVGILAGLVI